MKKVILTGDRPTGPLHIGHYVGSLKNRLSLQQSHECLFILADLHTLTTKPKKIDILNLRSATYEVTLDWLSCGIDPEQSIIFLQSAIQSLYPMQLLLSMLVNVNRLSGLPSIKEMAKNAHLDEHNVPLGLLGYPVLQAADILGSKAEVVPVGKDNEAHIELTRLIAKRFNQMYGEVFPLPHALLSDVPSLMGIDGKGKMSKSANNAIFLSDDQKTVDKKVRSMFTDPQRIHAHIPGKIEGNPLFQYHDVFNTNTSEVEDFKKRYRSGTIGDLEIKESLVEKINAFLQPIREKRVLLSQEKGYIERIIYEGTEKANVIFDQTYREMLSAMGLGGSWKKITRLAKEFKTKHRV